MDAAQVGSLVNLAAGTGTNLAGLAKTKLMKMQYTNGLLDGFFTGTGLWPHDPPTLTVQSL